jgi:hypothetical protein
MKKGMIAFIGMIIGLVFLLVAFLGPWYTMNGSGEAGMVVGLYLTRMEVTGTFMGQDMSLSMSYAEAREIAQTIGMNTESFVVIDNAFYLTLIAIITALIAVIGMAMFVFNKGKPKVTKLLGGGFGVFTFIFALVPALYFWSTGFAENSSGFWFSQTVMGRTLSGGPGYAWYLMIVVAIIALIASVAMLLKKSAPEAVPEPPQTV